MKRNVHLIPGRVEEGPAHIKFEDLRVFVGSKEVARLEDLVARVSLRGIELRALCGGRTAEGILSLRGNLYLKTRDFGCLKGIEKVGADLFLEREKLRGRLTLTGLSIGGFKVDEIDLLFKGSLGRLVLKGRLRDLRVSLK